MTQTASEIRAIAAKVHDQDSHSEADLEFLDALWLADCERSETLYKANIQWGGGSEEWQIVKRLATRQQEAAYNAALQVRELEAV